MKWVLGTLTLLLLAGLGFFTPETTGFGFSMAPDPVHLPLLGPDQVHPLGTDSSGRDILALLVQSTPVTLAMGFGAAFFGVFLGAALGCMAGYFRAGTEEVLLRVADIFLLLPTLPLVIVLSAYIGPGIFHTAWIIALTAWPSTARVIYARVRSLGEEPFVLNAKSMGAGPLYLMAFHILPNCLELLMAKGALGVAGAMLAEAGISFLGLGDTLHSTWGSMLHDAFTGGALVNGYFWWFLPPLGCISLSVTGFHMAGHLLSETSTPPKALVPIARKKMETPGGPETSRAMLLSLRNWVVEFPGSVENPGPVVNNLDLDLASGERILVIGETGSGKSLLLLSVLGLLPYQARISGTLKIRGQSLSDFTEAELRRHRGLQAAYVPQGLGQALNPVLSVGTQVAEGLRLHRGLPRSRAWKAAAIALLATGFPDPEKRMKDYPHQLSGGMKQRVLLAGALVRNPALILADEPTKGLDPPSVAALIEVFKSLGSRSLLAVTHDLLFARELGGKVMVMLSGMVMEEAPGNSFFQTPLHPYSKALLAASPERGMVFSGPQPPGPPIKGGGCPFARSCALVGEACSTLPPLAVVRGHRVRCWHVS